MSLNLSGGGFHGGDPLFSKVGGVFIVALLYFPSPAVAVALKCRTCQRSVLWFCAAICMMASGRSLQFGGSGLIMGCRLSPTVLILSTAAALGERRVRGGGGWGGAAVGAIGNERRS
jgi:hypothetical protein